jgi:nicotinate-nucleotide pyrophosphorylase (carboxylating)
MDMGDNSREFSVFSLKFSVISLSPGANRELIRDMMPKLPADVERLIDAALSEDLGSGDVTCEFFVPEESRSKGAVVARETGVVAGIKVALAVFARIDPGLKAVAKKADGDAVKHGEVVIALEGATRSILSAERTALNFLQRMSGVATLTSRYVARTAGTRAEVLDTRKTIPGWRTLDKAAVKAGGGTNHRIGLYDRAMVKDNHLLAGGRSPLTLEDLQASIRRLREARPGVEVELEADRLSQVEGFLTLEGVDFVLLDNMTLEQLREAVAMNEAAGRPVRLEASGGVNLDTVADIAATGVDFISVGALTHSARALDLALDLEP